MNPIKDIPRYTKTFENYLGKRIYLIFILTILAGISDGIGIAMFLPLLESLDSNSPIELSKNNSGDSTFIFSLTGLFNLGTTFEILIFMLIAFLFKGIFSFIALGYAAYFRGTLLKLLKKKMFDNYRQMSFGYYLQKDSGYFINVINEQINRTLLSFHFITQFYSNLFTALAYLVIAMFVAIKFGISMLFILCLMFILFKYINSYIRLISRKFADENGVLSKLLIQSLQSFRYLLGTNQTIKVRNHIIDSVNRLGNYDIKAGVANAFTQSIREPIAIIFILSLIVFQIYYFNEPITPILVSILLFYRAINSILSVQSNLQKMFEVIGSFEKVEHEFKKTSQMKENIGSIEKNNFKKSITFKGISFKYPSRDVYAIKDVNLSILLNETVAFVGGSGAGKSTLVDLMMGIHLPTNGEVFIDDLPSSSININSFRSTIGYVSQESVMFDDTILNNIIMWKTEDFNFERLVEVAKSANIHSFIESLPNGYDTVIGDRGLFLSGGQKQRLFIARELYRNPSLLILDEATSALDSKSENEIRESLKLLKGKITIVLIAHRLSTIKYSDRMFVLEEGKIVERGTFEELSKNENSKLTSLIELQKI